MQIRVVHSTLLTNKTCHLHTYPGWDVAKQDGPGKEGQLGFSLVKQHLLKLGTVMLFPKRYSSEQKHVISC